ncbi:MAG: PDZ domain-containing protein [Mycobacteriaceae bacterium]|nr:PDZ domain-containing protein [Mycobacteriaceae bacterium]
MNRRVVTLLVALLPVVVFGALLGLVTVPYVSLGPGPTFNTLGEVDGKEVVDIQGTKVSPTTGNLNMTTVAQRDDLTMGQALALWMSGREQLWPRDLVYPPDKSREEVDKDNTAEFEASEAKAEYAALGYLNYAPALTAEGVNKDGPSTGKLKPGDAIDKVDGTPITSLDQFQSILKQTKPGQNIVIDYRRKNAPPGTTTITLGKNADRDNGFLGVTVGEAPWAPFQITFNLANIGGPSAGLMFALAVIDKLTTGNLADSKFVAGTGSIDADGKVGAIGGITHKMLAAHEAGATVFLVPSDNCAEARSGNDEGLQLLKVDTVGQAVDALHTLSAGGEPPRC